jgi:hypothetical protein
MHRTAIDDVARDSATARCPDGIVEAIESRMSDWFAIGTSSIRIGHGLGSTRVRRVHRSRERIGCLMRMVA